MLFSSMTFVFMFLPILCAVYLLSKKEYHNGILLIASIIFYAWGEPKYLAIMLLSILVNRAGAILIDKYNDKIKLKKFFLILTITLNIANLIYFKYFNFLIDNFNNLFHGHIDFIKIALPLGISFYTFQALSYVIDVYRGDCRVQKNIYKLALFICLFPQLIAGPIVKYHDIEEQIDSREVNFEKVDEGVKRFIIGLAKKMLIANTMGAIADKIFIQDPHTFSHGIAWLGSIAYSFQLFFDFSGYSDMAIGLGLIFGFRFMENFNYPYISKSITEFWRRWHITLSSFFSDYVYKPLGGSRKGLFRTCLNLTIVFALSGFWHGANFNYLAWGLYNALFLIIERIITTKTNFKFNSRFGIIYVYIVWIFGMIIFRCEGTSTFMQFFKGLCSETALNYYSRSLIDAIINPYFVLCLIISILYLTPFFDTINTALKKSNIGSIVVDLFVIVLFIYAVMEMLTVGFNPFIYFRF